ncbi:MAG: SDR family NAD(P)-dependent oxidoreductase, partial [Planctomycetota bacterium]|nr:SDR family NAD(P)-dependent oxidoreductase [Planctomycetota bacterium]
AGTGTPPARMPQRVLITGAAQGIGRALADAWHARGADVVGLDLLDVAAPFATEVCDLAEPAAVQAALARLATHAPFDVVVHNAGVNESGVFERQDPERLARQIAVNLTAPLQLTAGLLRTQRLAPGGALVFVSSLSHQVGYPGAAVYAGSKDGLTNFARSMHAGLGPQGTNVLTVFPGPTRTEQARLASPPGSDEEARMPPAELAERIVRAVDRRRRILVPGGGARVFALLGRNAPWLTERAMRRAIYDKLA